MRILFVSDLHYALKQFDWLMASAERFGVVAIGGDLLDLSSPVPYDVQIVVVEEYLKKLRRKTRVLVCSGNHDGDRCNEADESVAGWLLKVRNDELFVDFDHVRLGETLVTVCPWWNGPVGRLNVENLLADGANMERARWVWIHHVPPDRMRVSWNGRRHLGDRGVNALIRQYRPDLVLSGHVHNAPFYGPNGSWIDRIGPTWVMNPGRQIGAEPSSITLDLQTMNASWASLDGLAEKALLEPENAGA